MDLAEDMSDVPAKFQPPYEWMYLDHDLGQRQYVSSDEENTGYAFVKTLPEVDRNNSPKVIVHSYNRDGAQRMVAMLHQKGYQAIYNPFGPTVLAHMKGLATIKN